MTLPASPMTASLSRRQPCPGGALPVAVTSVVGRVGSLRRTAVFLFSLFGVLFGPTQPSAHALSFNLTFDNSTVGAPAGFFTAFNDAVQFYETNFTDPITINLQVGWGRSTARICSRVLSAKAPLANQAFSSTVRSNPA